VDVRPVPDYAEAHLTGAVSIPLRGAFATWLGWVVSPERPVVFVRSLDQDPAEIAWQSAKVGYDNLVGQLTSGPQDWVAAGLPISAVALLQPGELTDQSVLDVRQDTEFDAGHVPGAIHVELGDLAYRVEVADRVAGLRDGSVVVMCGHGERAMTAASLLERAGATAVAVLAGGPEDWADVHGVPLELGW
jgi:rhodanese-related sulfurtransferase